MRVNTNIASLAWMEEFGYKPTMSCTCDECLERPASDLGPTSTDLISSTFAVGR